MQAAKPMSRYLILPVMAVVGLMLLAACRAQPAEEEAFVVADLFATPGKALATVELSPTPIPSATIPNLLTPTPVPTLPLPTVVVLQQPTLPIGSPGPTPTPQTGTTPTPTPLTCERLPSMPFAPIWQNFPQSRSLVGCPVGELEDVEGVFQLYEHGAMFWRQNDQSIFVLSELAIRQGQETDSWWHMDDTFVEGEAEIELPLEPPEGLIQPRRGFGKIWNNNAFIREAVGWAVSEEESIVSVWQTFDNGWMMTGPDGAPIYVMAPLDEPPYSSGIHLGPLP
jgi:hypothetical protein